jgi:hypothetical protein
MKNTRHQLLVFFVLLLCVSLVGCTTTATTSPAATLPTTSLTTPPTTTPPTVTTTEPPTTTSPPPTTQETTTPPPTQTIILEEFWETLKVHFGFMPACWDYENAREAGGAFDRPFFELFQWGMVEQQPGVFNFDETDKAVKDAQEYSLHILANIQPFAPWDQEKCHGEQPTNINMPGVQCTKYKPCDMEAYASFLRKLVERYDGDSIDDMPGLTVPIKHWELMNEPEFQTEPIYFQGTPDDYVDTLIVTYETIKETDPEALIVQGGMAGMMPESAAWWQGVFEAGGGQYFDIMNMHSIGHGEHLNIPSFKELLEQNGLLDKPIWVTEVQYQQSFETGDYTNEDFAKILARSYIFALANGVDKLFYVNLRLPPFYDPGLPFDERSALITDSGEYSALFWAHLTVANMLGGLNLDEDDAVATIEENVDDWFVTDGQYKFTIGGRTIYTLWGSGPLPAGITGEVRVVDIAGTETVTDAASIQLTDSPIFVLVD